MKFKNFIDSDIEDFRKLNIGLVKESKDELVRKIEEKFDIRNETVDLINTLNNLLGKKKFGFTLDLLESNIEKKIKKFNKKKIDTIKMKFFESNSFLSEMKRELEEKLTEGRYYSEIRIFDKLGDDYVHDEYKDNSKTPEEQFKKVMKFVKKEKNLKGEKIKINVFDTKHKDGTWNVLSKIIK
jgi:hypothetical protein